MPAPSFKPFNNSAQRFPKEKKIVEPGPGAYEHSVERNRSVQMLHSFGGRAQTVPHVHIKCVVHHVIKNVNKIFIKINIIIEYFKCYAKN
jgi:hypothetical protein